MPVTETNFTLGCASDVVVHWDSAAALCDVKPLYLRLFTLFIFTFVSDYLPLLFTSWKGMWTNPSADGQTPLVTLCFLTEALPWRLDPQQPY